MMMQKFLTILILKMKMRKSYNYQAAQAAFYILLKEKEYGKDGCMFMANAIAVFGGYDSYEDVVDQEEIA